MPQDSRSDRVRAGWVSLGAGILIFAGKLSAWQLTRSTAVFSDAMESTINIVAAGLLLFALVVAARPADRDHPYGHGKVEFFSAGIEGTFIVVAALLILFQAARALLAGPELRNLDLGLWLLAGFSALNLLLGNYLVRVGRRTHSVALVADGKHVLADVWTSAAIIAGLLAVWGTGWVLLDPLVAIAAALNILREGAKVTREAARGLMDHADPETLTRIVEALEGKRDDEWIDVHSLRARQYGAFFHVDLHLVVPRYLDVESLHDIHDEIEVILRGASEVPGDAVVHFDPCQPHECSSCSMPACPVRADRFGGRDPLSVEHATRGDEQVEAERAERLRAISVS
jgi:cation diffusion facilitator family transporter